MLAYTCCALPAWPPVRDLSPANDDLYESAALPFLRINQPRSGQKFLVGGDPHLVDVRVYNWPPSMWSDAYICVELCYAPQVGSSELYQGCFGVGTGVLPTWPDASFRFHAKLELFWGYTQVGQYSASAHLVVSSLGSPCALGSVVRAERPLGEVLVLTGATVVSSHVYESIAVDAPPAPAVASDGASPVLTTAASLWVQSGFASPHWLVRHVVASLAAAGEVARSP